MFVADGYIRDVPGRSRQVQVGGRLCGDAPGARPSQPDPGRPRHRCLRQQDKRSQLPGDGPVGEHVAVWKELVTLGEAIVRNATTPTRRRWPPKPCAGPGTTWKFSSSDWERAGIPLSHAGGQRREPARGGRRVQEIHKQVSAKLTPEDRFDGRCGWHTGSVDPAFGRRSSTGH